MGILVVKRGGKMGLRGEIDPTACLGTLSEFLPGIARHCLPQKQVPLKCSLSNATIPLATTIPCSLVSVCLLFNMSSHFSLFAALKSYSPGPWTFRVVYPTLGGESMTAFC